MSAHPTLPPELAPLEDVTLTLGARRAAAVRQCRVSLNHSPEKRSIGLDRAYSNKPLVMLEKQPVFPEIAVLALFRAAGWDGVWVDAPHRKYFDRMPNESKGISLPSHVNQSVMRVAANNGQSKAGCWDLLLWAEKTIIYVAVKSLADELRDAQAGWIDAAIRSGFLASQFIIVNWEYRSVVVKKKSAR